jgi:hypothetical protein
MKNWEILLCGIPHYRVVTAAVEIYNPLRHWHLSHIEDCHVNQKTLILALFECSRPF